MNKKMKITKIYTRFIASVVAVSGLMASCSKEALNTTNQNFVSTDQYFKTAAELSNGVNAAYTTLRSVNLVAREWYFIHDLRGDEVSAGGSQLEVPRGQMLNGNTDPTNSVMNSVWNGLYSMIHRSNTVIENGPNVTDNPGSRDRTVGEAKFLRAWAYFELVSQWGGVPLYITPVKTPSDYKGRAAVADVYAQIVKDLQDAAAVLPGKSSTDKGRATASAANMLLGRVLMQNGDYAGARTALLKIPTSGADGYALTNRFLDNFEEETEFNNESIFEVVYVDKGDNDFGWGGPDGPNGAQSTIRNQEYNPVAWRNLIPSNKALNDFENTATGSLKTDPRFTYSFYQSGDTYNNNKDVLTDGDQNGNSSVVNGVTKKVSFRKYNIIYKEDKGKASYHPGGNNQRLMRYAEVLINLAECENELNNVGEAVKYLNLIRARADVNMPVYPTAKFPVTTKADVVKAIMHEKTVEFCGEELRNIDILRWRKKNYFSTEPLSYFKANRDELLPIPTSELDNNPMVKGHQNPGY